MNTAKKSLTIGIALILISLTIFPSFSGKEFPNSVSTGELPIIIWDNTFDGMGYAQSIQQTSDEGYIISGTTSEDATLMKTDKNGIVEWVKQIGGDYGDNAYDAIECSDGGFLCTGGDGYVLKDGLQETFIIRTDEYGNELWHKTFRRHDRKGPCWGKCVVEVLDGYLVLATLATYGTTERTAPWLIKIDRYGNEIWNITYGKIWAHGQSLIESKEGGFVITGIDYTYDIGGADAWLLKIDSEGNELWNKSYGGYSYDTGEDVIQTDDGGYLIVGDHTPKYATFADVGLFKTDSSGNLEWIRHYGGTDCDGGYSVTKTNDGGYIAVGVRHSGLPSFQGWMLKTDGDGDKLWDKVIGLRAEKIIRSNDGKYVIAGFNEGAWILKFEDFENNMPSKPTQKYDKTWQQLKVASIDPDGDRIRYGISWYNNKVVDEWTGYYNSGEEGSINCLGKEKPAYVIAEDEHGGQSEWEMAKSKSSNPLLQLLERLIDYFPILEYFYS